MNHINSSVQIFSTSDYEKFAVINGNRGINIKKIKRIIEEIESGNDILQYCPVLVNYHDGLLHILDGQHRFFISKKLARPVSYIVIPSMKTMSEIASVNSNVEKWKQQDFVNCYVTQGNQNYILLKSFIDKYRISTGLATLLLEKGSPIPKSYGETECGQEFMKGLFEVKFEHEATELMELCKKFEATPIWITRPFIQAIYKINKAALININDLIAAVNRNPKMIEKQVSSKKMIYNLEQVMNVGKKNRIIIA